jgi:hypothetical protein
MSVRSDNLAKLIERTGASDPSETGDERFAAVQHSLTTDEKWVSTHDTFEDAAQYLGDEVLEGWDPEAVYDLDTGDVIGLHVSTPVVTRSEDALTSNVLREDE